MVRARKKGLDREINFMILEVFNVSSERFPIPSFMNFKASLPFAMTDVNDPNTDIVSGMMRW